MIKMKALRSFGLRNADEGHISRGREFTAANEGRARELEEHGLAYRLLPTEKMEGAPLNKMEPRLKNKAAESGPFDSVGGETGAENASSSSDQDHPQPKRRSKKPGDALDL
jgi:hypothetical protein